MGAALRRWISSWQVERPLYRLTTDDVMADLDPGLAWAREAQAEAAPH